MKNSKLQLLLTLALLAAFAFWAARPSRPAPSSSSGSSGTTAAAKSASAFFSKAVRSAAGGEVAVQPFPAAAGGDAAAVATAATSPLTTAAEAAAPATPNPLALAPPIPLKVAGPDQPMDFNREYVLIGGHKAHPSRLLAKFASQAGAEGVTTVLGEAQFAAFSAPMNRSGLLQLDSTSGKPTDVANATEAQKNGDALQASIKALKASGQFEYVEPDYIVSVNAVPNDAAFADGRLWGLRNTGQNGGLSGVDVGAVRAWDLTTGSTNVIVAIIDTGIRYTHRDLAAQMWRNPGEVGGNGRDDDNNGIVDDVHGLNAITLSGNPMDDNNHGTHCAGTIGAAANNGSGHVGVAWNVRLMGCKFLAASGGGATSHAIRCIDYAVSKRAKILSNSWGGGGYSQALYDAIRNARDQGVLFIAAAGNDGQNTDGSPSYPAGYELDNVISVAAIDRAGNLASFSNYGRRTVHLGAPGVAIYSSVATSDTAYDTYNGTSMATPHVAGVAALVAARFPNLSMVELKQRLLTTTVPTSALNGRTITGGRVNAYNALTVTGDGILEVSLTANPNPIAGGQTVVLTADVSDLVPVTNATVTATIGGATVTFRNDGTGADRIARDSLYTAQFTAPTTGASLTVNLTVTAPGKTTARLTSNFTVVTPPANDRFASRAVLTGSSASATGNNTGATGETGEPTHAGAGGRKSVWWTWTALYSGTVTITTAGSSFDTVLAAYTGTAVNALSQVAANDDFGGRLTSQISFNGVAGTAYHIAVDGFAGETGAIVLALTAPTAPVAPANDRFANRLTLSGSSSVTRGSNVAATAEAGEPSHAGVSGGKSVWWTWTAPASGPVTISTVGSSYDTTLGVYTGTAVGSLRLIGSNDDYSGLTSRVAFTATARTVYQIAVDGYRGASGSITLVVSSGAGSRATEAGTATLASANSSTLPVNGRKTSGPAAASATPAPAADSATQPATAAPVILTQPAALTLVRTNAEHITAATFTVTVSDAGAAAYQWHWNGLALAGETRPVLRLADARRAQSGDYTVTVSNAHGSVTSRPAHLRVASPMQTYPALRAPDGRTVLHFRDVDGAAISAADVPAFRLWIAPSLSTPADQWQTVSEGFSASQGLLWFEDMGGRLATQPHYLLEEVTQP